MYNLKSKSHLGPLGRIFALHLGHESSYHTHRLTHLPFAKQGLPELNSGLQD